MDKRPGIRHIHRMRRADRLFDILQILHDGARHRAQDIAVQTRVSLRTIYRDMDRLAASGIAIVGTRGGGYQLADVTTLPPLTLSGPELEALNLAIAIISEATDPELKSAALSLADKIDAALPIEAIAPADAWKFATNPFANAARGFSHMSALRTAIKTRQKLQLRHFGPDGVQTTTVRPLRLENLGRIWMLLSWSETHAEFVSIRTDLIEHALPLPELFIDEAGKCLSDYVP